VYGESATLAGGRLLRGSADQALQEGERGEAEVGLDPVPGLLEHIKWRMSLHR